MSSSTVIQFAFFIVLLLVLAKPLGEYIGKVLDQDKTPLDRIVGPVERVIYRIAGIDPADRMDWKQYTFALILFNLLAIATVFLLQKVQGALPLNPQKLAGLPNDLAFNTAVSFVTNTNWQAYGGETTMSHLTQMLGLTVQNFLSAATAMGVMAALARGIRKRKTTHLGNFWADVTRSTLYVLLPISLVYAVFLVSQGVVQTFGANPVAHWLSPITSGGKSVVEQVIAVGPVASQEAIKMLGTNGGGFFNANSAHPFENPTPLANFSQILAMLIIPASLCISFGMMVRDRRQGWAILAAMTAIFIMALGVCHWSEAKDNKAFRGLTVAQTLNIAPGMENPGGNMEGKETRFGITGSTLFATATTSASCGAVNSMHDSYTPMGGLVPLWLMELGEVVYGGVGSGLYGMLIFAMIAVFVSGLMVGRTPEYMGKKIEAFDMKMASLVILIPASLVLVGSAIGAMLPAASNGVTNPGAHGFTQILYAFSSVANNNGSAFAGLSANNHFYNYATGVVMLLGRFGVILPVLAIAGSLGAKKRTPPGLGTLPTHTPLFVAMLVAVVLLVGALTFLPALALGPIAEQLALR
jgi:K+-transporting ATPase ATPase A chain